MLDYTADKGSKKRAGGGSDESLLKEIRERFDHAESEWHDIKTEGRTDMCYVGGQPFDETDLAIRKGRPTVAPDELHQYFNQVINDIRAHPMGMKFDPTGAPANEKGAAFYQDKSREIEYRSNATVAYVTAAENAIQRSYGWVRVNTKYSTVPGQRFYQDLWIEHCPNPDMVTPDPAAKMPDSSDMTHLFYHEQWPIDEYARKHPKAKITSFTGDHVKLAPRWVRDRTILLAEYWKVKTTKRRLLLVNVPGAPAPQEMFIEDLDRMPEGSIVISERDDYEEPSVCQYLTNGLEVLNVVEWPGKYIPFVSCFGKVIYVDEGGGSKRKILSMTRFGRAPWKSFCYCCSSELEILGMTPKTPVNVYEGQLRGHEKEWAKASHEPVPFLQFKGTTEATGQTVLPPPTRIDYPAAQHLQAIEIVKEGYRRSIQAAMATNFLPTQAQRRNEKSGVALEKMDQSAQVGSFHFKDNYKGMIRQVAVICEDLMDKIYDTTRKVGIRKADETSEIVTINDPSDPESVSTRGDYLVTVSAGPRHDSEREAQAELADALLDSPFAPQIIDLVLKLRGTGPIIDEIADRLTPPQFRKGKEGQPDPQQMMQQLAQAKQMIDALSQKVQELTQQNVMDSAKAEVDAKLQVALQTLKGEIDLKKQQMQDATTIRVAEINASMKGYTIEAQHAAQHEAQALDIVASAVDTERGRAHERETMDTSLQAEAQQAEEARAHEADQSDRDRAAAATDTADAV